MTNHESMNDMPKPDDNLSSEQRKLRLLEELVFLQATRNFPRKGILDMEFPEIDEEYDSFYRSCEEPYREIW